MARLGRSQPFPPLIRRGPVGAAGSDSIVITAPVQYQTYQRSGTTGSIPISGTYVGTPTSIEASFNGGAYATIVASPSGGVFSGTLAAQAQGQGTLTVRFTNNTAITGTKADIGIGDIFLLAGDSNAVGQGTNLKTHIGTLKATVYANGTMGTGFTGWGLANDIFSASISGLPAAASLWPLLATHLLAELGGAVPVCFVSTALAATDVIGFRNQWAPGNSSYTAALARVTASGVNAVKAVLFHCGSNAVTQGDASHLTISQADYNAGLDAVANGFAADIAGAPKTYFLLFGENSTGSPVDRRLAENNVRQAVRQAWGDNANVGVGPNLVDQDYTDGIHIQSDAHLQQTADRWWVALKNGIYSGALGRGPVLLSAVRTTSTTIVLLFDQTLGNSLSSSVGGFRVTDAGVAATISSATVTSATQVTITVSAPIVGACLVSFASNDDAVAQTAPTSTAKTLPDARTITLPAEPVLDVSASAVSKPGLYYAQMRRQAA